MNKLNRFALFPVIGVFLAGCGPQAHQALRPSSLTPAPVAPVQSRALPSPDPTVPYRPDGYTPPEVTTAAAGGGDLQAIPELPSQRTALTRSSNITVGPDIEFGRNAVLGAWNVSAKADTCALNLSLTTWTNGFRASTRKCNDQTLTSIGSWTLAGKQLTLSNASGQTVARLQASGPNRFDGSTEVGGKPISVFR